MATPICLLLLPPQSPPKPIYSIPTLKLPNSSLHSNNLRWNSPAFAQKWPRIGGRTPVRAATGEIVPPSEVTLEKAQEIVPAASSDGIVSSIISVLLSVAFVALSILTIGVIYLAVQDFLQKREREKFEKEEAERKKKDKKKRRKTFVAPGPKGFTIRGRGLDDDDD